MNSGHSIWILQKDPFSPNWIQSRITIRRNFILGQLVFYHQDFFKTNYFFGFGRTEDIPMGYTYSASFAFEEWMGFKRTYTAMQAQKYWFLGKNLISTTLGFRRFLA